MASMGVNVTRGAGVAGGELCSSLSGCSAPPEIPGAKAQGAKWGVRQLYQAKLLLNRAFLLVFLFGFFVVVVVFLLVLFFLLQPQQLSSLELMDLTLMAPL